MERNVCGVDRAVRLSVGSVLALLVLSSLPARRTEDGADSVSLWQIIVAYAAGELLITGLVQWCPGNYLVGINTCERDWRSAIRDVRRVFPL